MRNPSLYRPNERDSNGLVPEPIDNQEIERLELEERERCWTYGRTAEPIVGKFFNERDAIQRAADMAKAEGFHVPIAVWNGDEEPMYLFIMGEQFRRV